jgi:hypothetical protein
MDVVVIKDKGLMYSAVVLRKKILNILPNNIGLVDLRTDNLRYKLILFALFFSETTHVINCCIWYRNNGLFSNCMLFGNCFKLAYNFLFKNKRIFLLRKNNFSLYSHIL